MRLEIPMLPPAELSPNARVHWSERHRAARDLRKAAWAIAYNANSAHDVMFDKAEIKVTLVYPNHQVTPDPDNLITMLKPALDGIVDAKIIPNDTKEAVRYVLPMLYEVDPQRAPLTIMEVEEAKESDLQRLLKAACRPVAAWPEFKERLLKQLLSEVVRRDVKE